MRLEKLTQLDTNLAELERIISQYSIDDITNDMIKQWALRYGLFESIQIMIDIACHVVSNQNFGSTNTFRDCLESLQKFDIISEPLSQNLKKLVGLRNILVHDYVKIEVSKLYEYAQNLKDFREFADCVKQFADEK
ncbi:MAG TPA: DUF86 domain-containing protein [Bacteroidetes bacterium]|nr:DUF86 domain-containing protein [Bacteroidota bacterium]